MSNRRKPRNTRKIIAQAAIYKIPESEREVIGQVPAVIHWKDVPNIEREDDETIGEAILYDDNSQDVVIWSDISEDAKKLVYGIQGGVDHFSIADPQEN